MEAEGDGMDRRKLPRTPNVIDVFIKRRVYGIFQKMLPYSVDIGTVYQMWFG